MLSTPTCFSKPTRSFFSKKMDHQPLGAPEGPRAARAAGGSEDEETKMLRSTIGVFVCFLERKIDV